ncbi:MAG: alcohol dehydrogenase [Saprospirales bacterium]|nr:MAG: alcohol dehydrogenase [Saprospirales bacterium]
MKAVVFESKEKGATYNEDFKSPEIPDDFVEISLKAAALNKRDDFILKGLYPGLRPNVVLGSDGCGVYEGQPVVFDPGINWGESLEYQSPDYHILGMPQHGTFCEKVSVPKTNIFAKPKHLDFIQASALPLAGLTAYRALFTRGRLKPGQKVLISGGGGGVALFCIQFAIASGARVYSTTGSEDKKSRLLKMGLEGVVNYNGNSWDMDFSREFGPVDLVIDSAGGDGLHRLVNLLNPGGTLVTYGGTLGKSDNISPQVIFWKQLNIKGSTMGSPQDFKNMIRFVEQHQIVPVVDRVFPLSDFNKAVARLRSKDHFGKIVLTIS